MLYTADGRAVLKHWRGNDFGKEEIIVTNVRANSTASYIPTPKGDMLVYITDSSTVAIAQFDEDEEEWVEDTNLPQCEVHPSGQLIATLAVDGDIVVVFQDAEGHLVYLQEPDDERGAWSVTEIEGAHKPTFGTPLCICLNPNSLHLHVVYVSSNDNDIHSATMEEDGAWVDALMCSAAAHGNDGASLKRIFMANRSEHTENTMYAITHEGRLLQLAPSQTPVDLGRMEKDGSVVPSTTAECCVHIFGLRITFDFHLSVGFETKKRRGRFF